MQVKYSYLDEQFADFDSYLPELRRLVGSGEFTLGPFVEEFEQKFARHVGAKHAISTNTGTDALMLALKGVGVKPGDEVITVPNTFVATVGAIVAVGARPVFVDCDDRYQIDTSRLKVAITSRTRAVLPVHWTGAPANVEKVIEIARGNDVPVVEDACAATGAKIKGRCVGTFGKAGAYSFHPLKPLNVWGDGGVMVTNDDKVASHVRLYRNHGLKDRDHVEIWGVNNRLQPVQAIVASRVLDSLDAIVEKRNQNARRLDEGLKAIGSNVVVPPRLADYREAYQIYVVRVKQRDALLKHLIERDIEAKVHYPIPLHLQRAAVPFGYKRGDFPACEQQADEIITLPCHQYVNDEQIDYMLDTIKAFYR